MANVNGSKAMTPFGKRMYAEGLNSSKLSALLANEHNIQISWQTIYRCSIMEGERNLPFSLQLIVAGILRTTPKQLFPLPFKEINMYKRKAVK